MRLPLTALSVFILSCLAFATQGQDSTLYAKLRGLPDKVFARINARTQDLEQKLNKQTEKYLTRLETQEKKLKRKLWQKDSAAAELVFGDVSKRYSELKNVATGATAYSGRLDSMQVAMRLLQQLPSLPTPAKYQSLFNYYGQLQAKLNYTATIKQQLKERQQYLQQQLQRFGVAKQFREFQKNIYYYRAQVDEYKNILENPSKLEAKLLQLATRIPAFKEFFSKHSMLASMFRIPGYEPVASATPIPGLQTRTAVQQSIVQRFGSGPDVRQAMQQNIQSAQAQVQQLKEKVSRLGRGSTELGMPDFKPNSQKVKSFWQRIETGANMQSVKSNGYFPVTSDIGLSAGYKLNDKSVVGVGVSYKMGWGESIRHIRLTHEGVGLRSFFELKLKGSLHAAGGFEYNYQQPFSSIRPLRGFEQWQQSGLIGVSKVVAVQSKLFKKTKVQLVWDFLSYQQLPRSQAIKFRIGYTF